MYDLRYCNPRMAGLVIRSTHRCGKPNCRCAKAKRYWHPAYYLEYKVNIKGKWRRKREYVPRPKVKALRQRIRRAKQKSIQRQRQIRFIQYETDKLIQCFKKCPPDSHLLTYVEILLKQIPKPVTAMQQASLFECLVALRNAI